jgi:hypothetical protein
VSEHSFGCYDLVGDEVGVMVPGVVAFDRAGMEEDDRGWKKELGSVRIHTAHTRD